MKISIITVAALAAALATSIQAADVPAKTASILVDAAGPRTIVSPTMFGLSFEDVNHAGEGGLYGEMVQNRDFEANNVPAGMLVEGNTYVKPTGTRKYRKGYTTDPAAWTTVVEGGAEAAIQRDTANPLNEMNPSSLKLVVKSAGQRAGVANGGFWGMNLQAGEEYDLCFYARTEGNAKQEVTAALEGGDGQKKVAAATICDVGGAWKQYHCTFKAGSADPKGRLVLSVSKPGTIWLDVVSLFPKKTFKNRPNGMRLDLAQTVADLKPGVIRFPGGHLIEGIFPDNRFQWKHSIGDIARRQGNFDMWGYYSTYGLGFHEYLQFCEDLGADALYVVSAGLCIQWRDASIPDKIEAPEPYVQETMDALEYAMGPATSKWGALRAANGHPAPFKIKYVEVGNENIGPIYPVNYKLFHTAIKAKYPEVILIANGPVPDVKLDMTDRHYFGDPETAFRMESSFDSAGRTAPFKCVGDYVVDRGVGSGNLMGTLAESTLMLAMERNAEGVKVCARAPILENINLAPEKPIGILLFDASRVVARSSYQAQKLFAMNRPDEVLKTSIVVGKVPMGKVQINELYALAGIEKKSNEVIIKAVNPTDAPVVAKISLKGLGKVAGKARVITLTGSDPKAENTIDNPKAVVPVESPFDGAGPEFTYTYKPYSLTVIRIGTTQ